MRYCGKKFENFVRNEMLHYLFNCSKAGRWWYRDKEIDIVAVNDSDKEIAFFECKWKKLKRNEVKKIIKEMSKKAELVRWNNDERKERFGVIAMEIEDKEGLRDAGFLVFDIGDLERMLDNTKR